MYACVYPNYNHYEDASRIWFFFNVRQTQSLSTLSQGQFRLFHLTPTSMEKHHHSMFHTFLLVSKKPSNVIFLRPTQILILISMLGFKKKIGTKTRDVFVISWGSRLNNENLIWTKLKPWLVRCVVLQSEIKLLGEG